jgi:hypothetical protein
LFSEKADLVTGLVLEAVRVEADGPGAVDDGELVVPFRGVRLLISTDQVLFLKCLETLVEGEQNVAQRVGAFLLLISLLYPGNPCGRYGVFTPKEISERPSVPEVFFGSKVDAVANCFHLRPSFLKRRLENSPEAPREGTRPTRFRRNHGSLAAFLWGISVDSCCLERVFATSSLWFLAQ